MRKLLLSVLLLPLMLACGHGEHRATLNHIDTLLRTNPNTALAVVDSLSQYENNMTRAERMRTALYRGVARIRNYMPVTDDSTAKALAKYYDSHGTPNQRMMAYYLLGCTYRDLGDTPMQLESFQTAVERADTTRADCDYYTMVSIYGHMANLYHRQVLPKEELNALKNLGYFAEKDHDMFEVLKAYELRIRPYILLRDTTMVLAVADTASVLYKKHGYDNVAAELLITPISFALDRKQYKKAKEYLDIFEKESGLFDKNGNIQKGREYHYFNKGRYLLGIGMTDSALYYFNKALNGGIREESYYGLLSAYEKKHVPDSVSKYAKLFASTNDSAWLAKNSQTVEQMTAMYNYSRHKKEAEENAVRAEHAEKTRTRLFLLLVSVVLASTYIYNKARNRFKKRLLDKEKELQSLEEKYMDAQEAYSEAARDIRLLKLEYAEKMKEMNAEKELLKTDIQNLNNQNVLLKDEIEEKISALNKLENDIEEETNLYSYSLEEKNEAINELRIEIDNLSTKIYSLNPEKLQTEFLESKIYQRFREIVNPKMKADKLTKGEWKIFTKTFSRCFPKVYSFLKVHQTLTSDQMRVCMLVKTGFTEGEILLLMDADNRRVSRLKTQANNKLFGENNAKTLRNNLEIDKK